MHQVRLLNGTEIAVEHVVPWKPTNGRLPLPEDPPFHARPTGGAVPIDGLPSGTPVWVEVDGIWRFGKVLPPPTRETPNQKKRLFRRKAQQIRFSKESLATVDDCANRWCMTRADVLEILIYLSAHRSANMSKIQARTTLLLARSW
ncbi:MAG: hypothetical protein HY849_01850 [Nitrosomonadales bacterium]|nr:hypothetical protein [Nitrosomonadales bacterium]